MSVSLDDLALLLSVAESGSFSRAAAQRGWSQPQVSQRIAQLEHALGRSLFARHRRGATPTAACEAFLPHARASLAALQDGMQQLRGEAALPTLRVSSIISLSGSLFGALIAALRDAPFALRCDTGHSPEILRQLLDGQSDIGFMLKRPAMAGIVMEPLQRSPINAWVAPDHPLAGRPAPLCMADLAGHAIAPHYWQGACKDLIALLHRAAPSGRPVHAVHLSTVAAELARRHGFVTFMPEMAAPGDLQRLVLRDLPDWHWEVVMAWRAGKRRDPAREAVLEEARRLWQSGPPTA